MRSQHVKTKAQETIASKGRSITSGAFDLDREIGTIEVGERADLLVLTGNPLQDVAAYNTIETVILGGDEIKRESLSALE